MESLTVRELEIMRHIVNGLSNHEIAVELNLAYNTIKWYNKRIYEKLEINTRSQLVAIVHELGLLDVTVPDSPIATYHLPTHLTSFVGRQREIQEILSLLDTTRLITLFGPGGIGKTRLAIEVANNYPGEHIYFVALEAVDEVDDLLVLLATLFDINLKTENSLQDSVLAGLPATPILLVLDNFETISAAHGLLPEILKHAPLMKILVTSQVILNLQAEYVYEVAGLDITATNEQMSSAIQLFNDRAVHLKSDFQLVDHLSEVVQICEIVGGLPLAIELAASWVRVLPCDAILAELQQGLSILSTAMADVEARHRNMVAICEQSWARLTSAEQFSFKALAIFRGDFSREAAEAVSQTFLATLASLVDKAILRMNTEDRYQIHSILRSFALEKLSENPTEEHKVRNQHAHFFLQLLAELDATLRSRQQAQAIIRLNRELDNILDAWHYVSAHGLHTLLEYALIPLARFMEMTDRTRQGADTFGKTLTYIDPHTSLYAGLLLCQGSHQIWLGDTVQATDKMFRALDLLDVLHIEAVWSMPMSMLSFHEGFNQVIRNKLQARYEHDLKLYLEYGQEWDAGWMEYALGNIYRADGLHTTSYEYLQRSLQRFNMLGDWWCKGWALDALSTTLIRLGDYDLARQTAYELYFLSQQITNHAGLVIALELLGQITQIEGDVEQAYAYYREALHYAIINATSTTIIAPILQIAVLIGEHRFLPLAIAVEAFTIVQQHPSSQTGWFSFREEMATQWLAQLQEELPAEDYERAVQDGRAGDLLSTARDFLAKRLVNIADS